MVTGRASNPRREGSIPSWPAETESFDDDSLHFLRGSRASSDRLRLRAQHDRVPRVHCPLLDVAATAREQVPPPASRRGGSEPFILRGRHSLARLRPCELMPAVWGDSSTGELCFRSAGIGVRFPVAPPDAWIRIREWGCSSDRRASRWHREGCRCDSGQLHRFECW